MVSVITNEELASNIGKSRKHVTIMFTDIVDSTRYWDQFGDVRGRMMIDQHNRLVFPVIYKFRGRIVKTIGDGLMAVFRSPNDALKAAVAIQQILQRMRNANEGFHVHIRIGIHTGRAIVEKNDIYGDSINVAKRVENFGGTDEIVLSEVAAKLLPSGSLAFHKKGSFIPKGKSKPLTVCRCRWEECKDMTRGLKASWDIPLDTREKGDLVVYLTMFLLIGGLLYQIYGRYLLADMTSFYAQLLALNPLLLFSEYPALFPAILCVLLTGVLILIRLKTASYLLFRILKGVAGFGFGFLLIYIPVHAFSVSYAIGQGQEIFKSEQVFARLPYQQAEQSLHLPLEKRNWYAFFDKEIVLPLETERHVPADRNAQSDSGGFMLNALSDPASPFYFRLLDLCALCLGIFGFFYGFMNFSIRLF